MLMRVSAQPVLQFPMFQHHAAPCACFAPCARALTKLVPRRLGTGAGAAAEAKGGEPTDISGGVGRWGSQHQQHWLRSVLRQRLWVTHPVFVPLPTTAP